MQRGTVQSKVGSHICTTSSTQLLQSLSLYKPTEIFLGGSPHSVRGGFPKWGYPQNIPVTRPLSYWNPSLSTGDPPWLTPQEDDTSAARLSISFPMACASAYTVGEHGCFAKALGTPWKIHCSPEKNLLVTSEWWNGMFFHVFFPDLPSGKLTAIENCHRNSQKWWIFL